MIWIAIAVVVAMALFGAPLFVVVLAGAMIGLLAEDISLGTAAIALYEITQKPLLVALPFFTFAGYLMSASNTSKRLMALTQALFGWMPAGLAVVGLAVCALFTALTGASGVTIVALGGLLLPMLVSSGYGQRFSLGLVTSSGSLGLLLVPSVPLILYGIVAQQLEVGEPFTIQQLFIAGILPTLLMLLLLSAYAVWRNGALPRSKFDSRALWDAVKAARWELPLPLVVLGGIYSGYFAVSEAAALTVLYVLIAEMALYREVSLKALPGIVRESMVMVGSILLILGVALAFTDYLIDVQVPQRLFAFLQEHIESKLTFLILLNILLLAMGAILDVFSALVIMVPLLLPVAVGYGIHPIHFGIIFLANLEIGYFTPPVGINLFIASYRFDRPMLDLYVACLPFMLVTLLALLLITYVPWFSMAFL